MIFLITALQSEARPLVDFFHLGGSDASSPFRTYRNGELTLVVSGVGRIASAAATAYAFARAGEPRNRPWLNVGIAGHPSAEVGSCWLANKIFDPSNGRAWYPSLVFDSRLPTAEVVTVDRPESRFEREALYDMEAAAFFAIASRFAPVELVQVLKVVSDNREAPASGLEPAEVSRLIGARVETIAALVKQTRGLADELAGRLVNVPLDLEPWIGDRHVTVSQRRKLSDLLRRLAVLEGEVGPSPGEFSGAEDARDLLLALEERLERQGVAF